MKEERVLRVVQCSQWTMDASLMWMKDRSPRHPEVLIPNEEIDRTWLVQFRAQSTTEWFSLFKVKESTLEGAGYGLFAARPYSWGDTLGVFYRCIAVKAGHQTRSVYAIEVAWPPGAELQQRLIVDPTSGPASNKKDSQTSYFGLHMANDPQWSKKRKSSVATARG
jgi:hypothetical protein